MFKLLLLLAITMVAPLVVTAQGSFENIVRTQISFAPGQLLAQELKTTYLHGDIEYFLSGNASFRTDAYLYLRSWKQKERLIKYNNTILAGIVYHFAKGRFDPYLAFQPGLNASKFHISNERGVYQYTTSLTLNPVISVAAGFNHFLTRHVHVFMNYRLIQSMHYSHQPGTINLNEFRFSVGIGFHVKRPGLFTKTG